MSAQNYSIKADPRYSTSIKPKADLWNVDPFLSRPAKRRLSQKSANETPILPKAMAHRMSIRPKADPLELFIPKS